jgi:ABC-2 type transport system ATP-binding protein
MIEVRGLVKRYGPTVAVAGIDFKIETGEIVGLLGPNGAGKSTTIKVLTTYLAPSEGTAVVAGFDVRKDPLEVRRRLGYLPENAPLYEEMRVRDFLGFIMEARGIPGAQRSAALDRIVAQTAIGSVLKKAIGELSKGYRQRVGLAQAMVHDPEILILDEPTSGLDPNQIVEIRNLIKEIGKRKTVVLSTHILAEVEAGCDRVIIIHRGRVAADGRIQDLERRESGAIRVRSPEPREKILPVLERIPGVSSVDSAGGAGTPFYLLRCQGNGAAGEAVFRAARDAGLVLSEIASEHRTLEDIFQDLTKER